MMMIVAVVASVMMIMADMMMGIVMTGMLGTVCVCVQSYGFWSLDPCSKWKFTEFKLLPNFLKSHSYGLIVECFRESAIHLSKWWRGG